MLQAPGSENTQSKMSKLPLSNVDFDLVDFVNVKLQITVIQMSKPRLIHLTINVVFGKASAKLVLLTLYKSSEKQRSEAILANFTL